MTGINNPTLVAVPQGGGILDVLAERYRAAYDKMQGGREQWIEGTLELAVVVAKARKILPDHRSYSRWLQHHGLEHFHPNDRMALVGFSKDLEAARKLLEGSKSISWRALWETRPNKSQRTLTNFGKGAPRTDRGPKRTGHGQRNRPIPTVMRDDDAPPPPQPPKRLSDLTLTPEQVDPDFKGTPLQFTTKYGHVLLRTKEQIEQTKRQEALMAWLGTIADLERMGRAMLVALANVDPATLAEWTSKPAKAEKFRAWCDNIQVACEAIGKLRPSRGQLTIT